MKSASDPQFVEVDLTALQDAGVLMAVNERLLWPLGLALTWYHDSSNHASGLHIREWEWPDGHRESIAVDPDDPIANERRRAFTLYLHQRAASLPAQESIAALDLLCPTCASVQGETLKGLDTKEG